MRERAARVSGSTTAMPMVGMAGMVVALVVALVSTACTGAEVDQPPATEPPVTGDTASRAAAPTTLVPTATDEEAAVLAAVDGYWRTFIAANDPPNPDHPDLERYMNGPALETSRAGIASRAALSQSIQLPPDSRYGDSTTIEELSLTSATVRSCLVDDSLLLDGPSGLVLNSRVTTFVFRMTLTKSDRLWRVVEVEELTRQEDSLKCG